MKSRWLGEFIYIKQVTDDDFIKCKIIDSFREMGNTWYSCVDENGHAFDIPTDTVSVVGRCKKAKVIPFKSKLKLISN